MAMLVYRRVSRFHACAIFCFGDITQVIPPIFIKVRPQWLGKVHGRYNPLIKLGVYLGLLAMDSTFHPIGVTSLRKMAVLFFIVECIQLMEEILIA